MDECDIVRAYKNDHAISEIAIYDMDRQNFLFVDAQGRRYHEVATNIWAHGDEPRADVAYLGTGRHGGGIILRPLYIKIDDVWRNATTGREAPSSILLS